MMQIESLLSGIGGDIPTETDVFRRIRFISSSFAPFFARFPNKAKYRMSKALINDSLAYLRGYVTCACSHIIRKRKVENLHQTPR